eukprot:1194258-Prorocentrum_minimum.AAC.5
MSKWWTMLLILGGVLGLLASRFFDTFKKGILFDKISSSSSRQEKQKEDSKDNEENIQKPIDCVGDWSDWSVCALTDPDDECATRGVRTKTFVVTENAKHGGKLCEKTHGQKLTRPCTAREIHTLPRKCHPDAKYDCQGHYQDKDEYCQNMYQRDPGACGVATMAQLPFVITKDAISDVVTKDGKIRRNVGLCPLKDTFVDVVCSGNCS